MKYVLIVAILGILFILSSKSPAKITSSRDYERFLDPSHIQKAMRQNLEEAAFWNRRLKNDTGSFVNKMELARYLIAIFHFSGRTEIIEEADSLLKSASICLGNRDADMLFALSQNSITRHQFREAARYTEAAATANADQYTLCLLQFDAAMERGLYPDAIRALEKIKDKSGFDYLIRKAKWQDHQGDLSSAIALMERAMEKVQNQERLRNWAMANLADMYAHAGQLKQAYEGYLQVLSEDPSNFHCLQGIAWIAYSHDRDLKAADNIYSFICSQRFAPDIVLLRAELATERGDNKLTQQYTNEFFSMLSGRSGKEMYHKYLIEELAMQPALRDSAVSLAAQECKSRFTPETCDLMAWALFQRGDTLAAYRYAKAYVYRRSVEPPVLFHTAMIFSAAGDGESARKLIETCLESSFELGPVKTKELLALRNILADR
jgi:tetratricopeptide (TPR) repeat protein